jgi:hypothetical protein
MADEAGAINTDAGASPQPAQIGELVSTVEFHNMKPADTGTEPEGAKKTGAAEKTQPTEGKETEGGKKAGEAAESEVDRFDKHPRFQELIKGRNEDRRVIAELKAEMAELKAGRTRGKDGGDGAEGDLPFKDISKMKTEELLDWQSEKPHEFYQNVLAQAKHELQSELSQGMERRSKEDAIVGTFEAFAQKNSDFDEMWDTGVLPEFMSKNPGHNAISAYYALTADARLKAATEKAVKDAEAAFIKNQRAKRVADVLPKGPSAPGGFTPGDEALKDSKKFGGTTAVLAQRLAERRRSQAGM